MLFLSLPLDVKSVCVFVFCSQVAFAGNLVVTLHETETLDLVQSDVLALQQLFGSFLFFTGHFHSSYFLSSG